VPLDLSLVSSLTHSTTPAMSFAIPETTDYPSLSLGYSNASCTTVNIVGLDVKVYGLEETRSSSLPLAAVVSFPPFLN